MVMDSRDMPTDMSRRVFIKGLGYVSLGLMFSTMLGGCETLLEQIANRPIRRRLRTGSTEVDNVLAIYADAVTEMRALPSSNPRSWAAQAAIHGTGNTFNFCHHGSPHFFSWHRAYLLYFERICRELTGEQDFALPYWNWNQNPAIHPEFLDEDSPLFQSRNNTSLAGFDAFSNDTMNTIFSDGNFFSFGSQIEGTPHNLAHGIVGGVMASGGSPLDPIFWAHHCMADYCWAKWNIELENDNPDDASWNETSWDHFTDGDGDPVTVTAGGTVLMPLLSYRYETSAVGGFAAARALSARSAEDLKQLEKRLRKGAEVRFEIRERVPIVRGARITLDKPFSAKTRVSAADFASLVESDRREERIFVSINYAQLPPASDFFVRVFINLPSADARTPTDDPHYAGSFAFFGTQGTGAHGAEHDDHDPKTDFLVNVTDTLQKLRRSGALRAEQPLSVQLVAVPMADRFSRPEAQLTLQEVELVVSPVKVRAK